MYVCSAISCCFLRFMYNSRRMQLAINKHKVTVTSRQGMVLNKWNSITFIHEFVQAITDIYIILSSSIYACNLLGIMLQDDIRCMLKKHWCHYPEIAIEMQLKNFLDDVVCVLRQTADGASTVWLTL